MKKCSKCKIEKCLSDFYGENYWCKKCHLNYYKTKSYSKIGKEKQLRDDLDNGNRICNKCKIEKTVEDFPKNKKCKSGRERTCKKCVYKSRENKKDNQKKLARKWYLENRELTLKRQSKYYQENKERLKAYGRQHTKDNPEIYKAASHRRRAAIKNNGRNDLTADQIRWLFDNFQKCIYCGIEDDLTIDHIKPISKGGQNTLDNIVVACMGCNNKKRTRTVSEVEPGLFSVNGSNSIFN